MNTATQAARIIAAARQAQDGRTPAEAAQHAHRAGGPTVADITARIAALRCTR